MYREAERLLASTVGAPVPAPMRAALSACRFRLGTLSYTLGEPDDSLSVLRQAQADQDLLATAPEASDVARNDQARTISRIGAFLSEMGSRATPRPRISRPSPSSRNWWTRTPPPPASGPTW